ncbi:THO complex subunit 5 homolog [Tigriopus californicus]|uniref:THO complex subunit 5 homolog n=1 Tax=Tigriopus californicus TaxID=6832 RepID=UPI0027DA4D7D|nr:THO complex subunit 5 homolog [Tigriopus californicus]
MSPIAKEDAAKGDSKKRKVVSSVPSPAPKAPKLTSKAKMYSAINKLEEEQAKTRPSLEDSKLFQGTCDEIRKSLKDILDLKLKKASKTSSADIGEARINASLHFLTLKKLNRLDKFRIRGAREETNLAKQKVDSLNLQLQNLLYELSHLQKEITKCQQFKSKHEDIDLIPVEEFHREAPESIVGAVKDSPANPHQLQLLRLDYENIQRKDMNTALSKLEDAREALEKQIGVKRDKLASLKPQLANILEVTKPVQEYLEMPLTQERDQLALHRHLPHPLFILYVQTSSYGKACDKWMNVKIKGDLEETKNFYPKDLQDLENDDIGADESRDDEDEANSKAKRSKKGSSGAKASTKADERLQVLLKTHPLEVDIELYLPDESRNTYVHLNFKYLYNLEIVGVKTTIHLDKDIKSSLGDLELLLPDGLLSHLDGETDSGMESPNPGMDHVLKTLGITSCPPTKLNDVGFPFRWVQLLGGLNFPQKTKDQEDNRERDLHTIRPNQDVAKTRVQGIIHLIRERLEARVALQKQITLLQKAKMIDIALEIPNEVQSWFPLKASSRLRNWTAVNWEQYKLLEVTQHLVQGGAVDENDFFYRLQINREPTATLIALIAIKPDYPNRNPVFCLNLHWKGEFNVHNCEHMRDLERLINSGFDTLGPKLKPSLLSMQLQRLLTSLDALLEAWSVALNESNPQAKVDFQREKLFLQSVRGRNRSLPINFDPKLQVFV